jgi:ferrochelatase
MTATQPSSNQAGAGVVLVNLGTPDEPTLPAVQRYLREFLLDRRIVDLNPLLWRVILETRIMHGHAKQSTEKYKSVWYENGSPLLVHTREQAAGLAIHVGGSFLDPSGEMLAKGPSGITVTYGFRYGRPSLAAALDALKKLGVWRVLIVPLYPQFSTTTVATVSDALSNYLKAAQDQPETRWIRSWPDEPSYIEACASRIEGFWEEHGRPDFPRGDKLLLSYHGIPVKCVDRGDPYPKECETTTDLLRDRLDLGPEHLIMSYQSKFGKGEWLTPATIDTVAKLGELGTGRLDVFCPGFAADCLETLEENGLLNRDAFPSQGGGDINRIPCLNDSGPWLECLEELVLTHVQGWV